MFTQLTDLGDGVFGLPRVGSPLRGNKTLQIGDIRHPRTIFRLWSTEKLNAIGVAPYVEARFDQRNYVSTGNSDAYANGTVTTTHTTQLKDVELLKTRKISEIESYRKHKENGSTVWSPDDGVTDYVVDTSEGSQIKVTGAIIHINENGGTQRKWSMLDTNGDKVRPVLTKQKFKAMAIHVGDHVDAAYEAEEAHVAALANLTAQQVLDYDHTVDITGSEWPVNSTVTR